MAVTKLLTSTFTIFYVDDTLSVLDAVNSIYNVLSHTTRFVIISIRWFLLASYLLSVT